MKIFITGVAGVLGSNLANHFARRGFEVKGNDIVRPDDAWRLEEDIEYLWKSTEDLQREDIRGVDAVIDCGLAVPDRPFGIESPYHTAVGNILPPLRLLEVVRRLPKKERPTVVYPSCYSEDTEILTRNGWKTIHTLSLDDEITSLNPKTFEIEYVRPVRIIKERYSGKMIHFKGKSIDLLVTPNHNMFAKTSTGWKLLPAEELANRSWFELKTDAEWKGEEVKYFVLPKAPDNTFIDLRRHRIDDFLRVSKLANEGLTACKISKLTGIERSTVSRWLRKGLPERVPNYTKNRGDRKYLMDDWLEFLGYLITDGHIGTPKNHYRIELTQKKKDIATRMESVMRRLFGDRVVVEKVKDKEYGGEVYHFIIYDYQLWYWLVNNVGRLKHERRIPREFLQLSRRQLKILFEALMRGDGSKRGDMFTTSSKELAEQMLELALKVGYSAKVSIENKSRAQTLRGRVIHANRPLYRISVRRIRTTPYMRRKNVQVVDYDGLVWCVALPKNHIIYVKRNGCPVWSGNSFNACYASKVITEQTLPDTTSVYGWAKGAVENLYRVYHRAYGVPVIITRVGSCFSEKGRSEELPHRLIIYALKGRKFYLRSPHSKRLWTYARDAIRFYDKLIEKIDECVGLTLHCCGNAKDEVLTNVELAEKVRKILPLEYELGEYEPGEEGIDFEFSYEFTKQLLGWKPIYTVDEGLRRCVKWFKENLWRYR